MGTPPLGPSPRENLVKLSEMLEREMSATETTKSSIEARALGIFALDLGIATLYLAVREQFKLPDLPPAGGWYWVLVIALCAAGASLTTGLVTAWPGTRKPLTPEGIEQIYTHKNDPGVDFLDALMKSRVEQYRAARDSNIRKSVWIAIALTLSAVSIVGLALSVLAAVFKW